MMQWKMRTRSNPCKKNSNNSKKMIRLDLISHLEASKVVRNINYAKTFTLISHLEAIHILLSCVAHTKMRLYQMKVKNTFINGVIKGEVYVEQSYGFESHTFPHYIFNLYKALYGLKQAPRAWYERLSSFLVNNGVERGKLDTTLFRKNYDSQFILVQIYVDDIIFGATNEPLYEDFSKLM